MRRISKENNKSKEILTKEELDEINDIELERISKSNNFEKIYDFFIDCCFFLLKTTLFLLKVSGIYLLWICLHYFSAHLYIKFCVPNTIVGFIMSPFMIATPHCQEIGRAHV